jgi:hypothetical protein
MRCSSLAVFGVLWLLAASSVATAQIQVTAQTQRSNYLLYERVDLLITIQNMGDTDLVLNNSEGHPWLSFLVTKRDRQNHLPVRPERTSDYQQVTLKVGESKTLGVNLTPLFSFREEGDYNASAVVDLPGQGQVISEVVPFTVLEGRKVWSQTRPVDGSQRLYSLIRFSPEPDRTQLYLRVEGPSENIIYTNLALGDVVAFVDPGVQFDPQGNLHILHPIAMGTYLYTRADQDGKILHQNIFKTYREIPPRLAKVEDGNVIVNGGLAEDPNTPQEKLSDAQNVKKPNQPPVGSVQ